MSGPIVVAAFDFDGTLTARDCVTPFLCRLGGWHGIVAALAAQPARVARAAARRDRDAFKEVVVGGVFRGRSVAAVAATGEAFAQHVAAHWLRAEMCARLAWHQHEGHRTVVVSASLGPYLRPLARRLAVDAVLCTEVGSEGGLYRSELDGGNCRGPEKARRLRQWIEEVGAAGATTWAYGDSAGDREMLAMADHPVVVRRRLAPV